MTFATPPPANLWEYLIDLAWRTVATLLSWYFWLPVFAQVLLGAGLCLYFASRAFGNLVEQTTIAKYKGKRALKKWREEREWNRLGAMDEKKFRAVTGRIRKQAEKLQDEADLLNYAAEAAENGHTRFEVSALIDLQRAHAERKIEAKEALEAEATRIEALWVEIVAARKKQELEPRRIKQLIQRLDHKTGTSAEMALAELNKISSSVDWEKFVPRNLPELVQARAVRLLRSMGGTNNLNEARNALALYLQILTSHNLKWQNVAA